MCVLIGRFRMSGLLVRRFDFTLGALEPASNRRNRRKAGRQHPSRQAAAKQIEDRHYNSSHELLARARPIGLQREE